MCFFLLWEWLNFITVVHLCWAPTPFAERFACVSLLSPPQLWAVCTIVPCSVHIRTRRPRMIRNLSVAQLIKQAHFQCVHHRANGIVPPASACEHWELWVFIKWFLLIHRWLQSSLSWQRVSSTNSLNQTLVPPVSGFIWILLRHRLDGALLLSVLAWRAFIPEELKMKHCEIEPCTPCRPSEHSFVLGYLSDELL